MILSFQNLSARSFAILFAFPTIWTIEHYNFDNKYTLYFQISLIAYICVIFIYMFKMLVGL